MSNSGERHLGRAKNAVLSFLEQRLSIPKIYIDADWAGHRIDVLAINRDGAGDVHAVLMFPIVSLATDVLDSKQAVQQLESEIMPLIERFKTIPAQYKYVAAVDIADRGFDPLPGLPHPVAEASFSPDGIGRVGFMAVQFVDPREPLVRLEFKPERFRAQISKLAEDYIHHHEADWEIRA